MDVFVPRFDGQQTIGQANARIEMTGRQQPFQMALRKLPQLLAAPLTLARQPDL